MFGCESAATAFASRSNRDSASGSAATDSGSTLIGDVPVELLVPGPVDLSHSARTERREDLVRTETGAGSQGHANARSLRLACGRYRRKDRESGAPGSTVGSADT